MSADQIAALAARLDPQRRGHVGHPERVGGPVSLPEALETEFGERRREADGWRPGVRRPRCARRVTPNESRPRLASPAASAQQAERLDAAPPVQRRDADRDRDLGAAAVEQRSCRARARRGRACRATTCARLVAGVRAG